MQSIKFSAPLVMAFELNDIARKQARSVSEVVRHMVERGLGMTPEAERSEEVTVEKMERGRNGRAVAIYMSQPIEGDSEAR